MNYWLQRSKRRQLFNKVKQCSVCLYTNTGEGERVPVEREITWKFQQSFTVYGYRMYDWNDVCIKDERFPSPFDGPPTGGSVSVKIENLVVDFEYTIGQLFSEFEPLP